MPTYVEEAILRLRDDASPTLRRVNRELRRLYDEAERLGRSRSTRLTMEGVEEAMREVRRLREETRRLTGQRNLIRMDVSGNARQELANLSRMLGSVDRNRTVRLDIAGTRAQTIARLNAEMDRLQAQAPVTLRVDAPGLPQTVAEVRELLALLRALPTSTNVRVTGQFPAIRSDMMPAFTGGEDGRRIGRQMADGFMFNMQPERIGLNMARAFTHAVSGELYNLMRGVVRTGATAPLSRESAEERFRVQGRSQAELDALGPVLRDVSQRFGFSETALLTISGDFLGRIEGSIAEDAAALEEASRSLESAAETMSVLRLFFPNMSDEQLADQARLVEATVIGTGASTPEERKALRDAIIQGIIASGGDIQGRESKRTMQQLGELRAEVGDDTFLQALLLRDEQGQRGTGEVRQAYSDLLRETLSDAARAAQVEAGLRLPDGTPSPVILEAFREDFLNDFVGGQLIPILEARGVDTADPTAVSVALTELGFVKGGGIASLTDAVVNLEDRLVEFRRGRQVDVDRGTDPENRTTVVSARAVQASFDNLMSEALGPALPLISSGLDGLADTLNQMTGSEAAVTGVLGTAALGAAAVPVALSASLLGMMDPATRPLSASALALTGAAANLNLAAASLSAVGGLPDVPGPDGRRRGGMNRSLMGWFAAALAATGGTAARVGALTALAGMSVQQPVMSVFDEQQQVDIRNLSPEAHDEFMSIMRRAAEAQRQSDDQTQINAIAEAMEFLAAQPTSGLQSVPVQDAAAALQEANAVLANAIATADARSRALAPGQVSAMDLDAIEAAEDAVMSAQQALVEVLATVSPATVQAMVENGQLTAEMLQSIVAQLPPVVVEALTTATPLIVEMPEQDVSELTTTTGEFNAGLMTNIEAQRETANAFTEGASSMDSVMQAGAAAVGAAMNSAVDRLANMTLNVNGTVNSPTPAPRLDTGTTGPQ